MNPTSIHHDKVHETLLRLETRIAERFLNSNLRKVFHHLLEVTEESSENIEWISRPLWLIRGLTYTVIAISIIAIVYGFTLLNYNIENPNFGDILALAESTINDLVLLGAAIFFLLTLENRMKRSRALKKLNELRAMAHVIDMHQLTKDPTAIGESGNT